MRGSKKEKKRTRDIPEKANFTVLAQILSFGSLSRTITALFEGDATFPRMTSTPPPSHRVLYTHTHTQMFF